MSRKYHLLFSLALVAAMLAGAGPAVAQPVSFFAERVIGDPVVGSGQSPAFADPQDALGGPTGTGSVGGSTSGLFTLGAGGSITLGFGTEEAPAAIFDGPGDDFTVFENAFFSGGNPAAVFAELLFVEVSTNGIDFVRFLTSEPVTSPAGAFTVTDPATATGFAGVAPVFANVVTNEIDPFDPAVSGGDAFDLADLIGLDEVLNGDVDLNNIRFLRLIDVVGLDGPSGSADLDAVAVINGIIPEPATATTLLALTALGFRRRRV